MSLTRSLASLSVLLVAGPMLAAQVFVVDAAGGAGSHFTDLPAAVAAVPNGATLRVRAGNYTGFVIDGKGLTIVGEGGVVSVNTSGAVATPVVVQRTTGQQPVLLKGLTFTGFWFRGAVEIRQAAGPVVLDSIGCTEPATDFLVDQSANVLFHACSLVGGGFLSEGPTTQPKLRVVDSVLELSFCAVNGHDQGNASWWQGSLPGYPAMTLLRSRCVLTASTLRGGYGMRGCHHQGPGRCGVWAPGTGGLGIDAEASTLVIRSSTIAGQRGHAEFFHVTGLVPAGNGGDGLRLRAGSRATALLSSVEAGPGGAPNGLAGVASVVDSTSTLVVDPTARPTSVELLGTHTRGGSADFVVLGAPLSPAVLLFSYRADIVPLEPIAFGSMLASIPLVLGPYSLSPLGDLRGSLPLSTTWPVGETYFAQVLSLAPGTNAIWPSNRVALHVNH